MPKEYNDYARLLRRIGIGPDWPEIAAQVKSDNPYVIRYLNYFEDQIGGK